MRARRPALTAAFELAPILRQRRQSMGAALSGDHQQMLAVGRALLGNPHVLLLGNPPKGWRRCCSANASTPS